MADLNFFELLDRSPKIDFESILRSWNNQGKSLGRQAGIGDFNSLIFKQFKSFESSFEAIEEAKLDPDKRLTSGQPVSRATRFVSTDKFDSLASYKNFLNTSDSAFEASKDVAMAMSSATKSLINLAGSFKKDRIRITSDERGIFDFSLASQGLYRPVEFFSEDFAKGAGEEFTARNLPRGVIPPEFIDRNETPFGYNYTYTDSTDKVYLCERRQIGTTDVFNHFPNLCLLKRDEQGLILPFYLDNQDKVFNGDGEHRLKYASSSKNVYLMFDKQEESTKYVDIFLPVNYVGVSNGNRIANALIPILISSSLEEFGIKTRISAVRNGIDDEVYVAVSIPIKEYEERTLDKADFILNLMGKSNTAGQFFAFHKVYTENEGQEQPNGLVASTTDTDDSFDKVFYYDRIAMLDLFARYKNWVGTNQGKDFVQTKVKDSSFQLFLFQAIDTNAGMQYFPVQMQQTAEAYLEQMPNILFQYFFYLDYLSIQYLPISKFVQILLKRFEEDENFLKVFKVNRDRGVIRQTITEYFSALMFYRYFYVEDKAYADSPENIQKKKEAYEAKIVELNEVLKAY
jgi:hypothetical protein